MTSGFADLDSTARDIEVGGVSIRVADLADVNRSRPAVNRPKDQRVLPVQGQVARWAGHRGSGYQY